MSVRRPALLLKKIRDASTIVKPASAWAASAHSRNILSSGSELTASHYPKAWKYTKVVTAKAFLTLWQDPHPHQRA